ncbi:bifunctional oligoribonuclease/PAP phosphatase NrnA [Candidatus Omnitrophota bacterium]
MKGLAQAIRYINKAKTIAIAGHINPDGDCIGSLLSLGCGLKKLGKRVTLVSYDGVPKKYRKLPGAELIKRTVDKKVDLAITVDCNAQEMLGGAFKGLRKADTILEIDHHEIRDSFGDIRLVDEDAAAVGEQVYILLKKLGVKITTDIAQNILTSLIVETNSFKLPNVRPFTFEICAELVKTGVNFYKLVDMVYWSNSREVAILSGICIARSKFLGKGRLVWSIAKREDFKKVKGKDEDVDAVADEMRSIAGVDIVVFFREKSDKKLRISLRSKKNINIALLAEMYGGGGHSDVAGCTMPNDPKAMQQLLRRAKKFL